MNQKSPSIILVTRKSPLALWQAQRVQALLQHTYPNLTIKLLTKTTEGDKQKDVALNSVGGKDLFVKDLQIALLNEVADIAVHSIKDMSAKPYPGLTLAAVLERDDPRDALIAKDYPSLQALPKGAIIGTASPRRECLLKMLRPDLNTQLIRGNVDTRLKKLAQGNYHALILSAAGLKRLGLTQHIRAFLDPQQFIPAIGQGTIGIECRTDDERIKELIAPLNHTVTYQCITAERAVNARLGGDCFTPIAAHATLCAKQLKLQALVGQLEGDLIFKSECTGSLDQAQALGLMVAEDLIAKGAERIL